MRNSAAVEAGSVIASGVTAAQVSQKEQGMQAYEAERLLVWSCLGTAQTDSSSGVLQAAAAQASEGIKKKPTFLCFFAAAQVCRGVTLLSKDGRPVRRCPMSEQGQCPQLHDAATRRTLWTDDAEFQEKLDVYMEIVEKNKGRILSKAQL